MKWILFYFSGTGNTWWASNYFGQIARNNGVEVVLIPITSQIDSSKNLKFIVEQLKKGNDFRLGFAFPIYGARMPPLVMKFISQLMIKKREFYPEINIPVFSITTVGYINAYGPFRFRKFLKQSGFHLKWALVCRLGSNVSTPELRTHVHNKDSVRKLQHKSKKKIEKFLKEILEKPQKFHGIGPWLLGGYFVPKILGSHIKNNYTNFSVDPAKCIKCMACVNSCPADAIIFQTNLFQFLDICTACMRCYTFCPTHAILRSNKYADPQKYPRFRLPEGEFQKIFWSKNRDQNVIDL